MPMVVLGWKFAAFGQGDDFPTAQAPVETGKGCVLIRVVDGVKGRAVICRVITGLFV